MLHWCKAQSVVGEWSTSSELKSIRNSFQLNRNKILANQNMALLLPGGSQEFETGFYIILAPILQGGENFRKRGSLPVLEIFLAARSRKGKSLKTSESSLECGLHLF